MRRLVVVLPDLLSEADPVLDRKLPHFSALAESGRLVRLSALEPVEAPEARFLGISPSRAALKQGPLTVAALGADPPPNSLHFHVSLLSLGDDGVAQPDPLPSTEEVRAIVGASARLNTRKLTFVAGFGVDHGLVWESLGDLATTPPSSVVGHGVKGFLPEGDGEPMLRQFIDDSVNLLGEFDFNRRRLDEGVAPLNLLWPWGQGERKPVPNLALHRGQPALVLSESLRLAGLTRLVGYRHSERGWLGERLQTRLSAAVHRLLGEGSGILVLNSFSEFRASGELDEAAYFAGQIDAEVLKPILEAGADEPLDFLLAAPGKGGGLAVRYLAKALQANHYPFDERSLEEGKVSKVDLETVVDETLTPESEA